MKNLLLSILFSVTFSFAQGNIYNADPFEIKMLKNSLEVSSGSEMIYSKVFSNAEEFFVDLDGDSLNEFFIIDQTGTGNETFFSVYVYNTLDSFFLADSINSGTYAPYFTVSEEIGGVIIITGNASFLQFAGPAAAYLPVNCYKYDSGEIYEVNDEIYDLFISENEDIIEFIENYFENNIKNCSNSKAVLSALSSAYANYINAAEPTLARQLINNFYLCDDRDSFIKEINNLILNNFREENENQLE